MTAGVRLHPKDICLLAVTHLGRRDIDPADRAPLRKWRTAEAKRLKRASDGITLGPIRFRQVDELSVREYRDSSPLRVPDSAARRTGSRLPVDRHAWRRWQGAGDFGERPRHPCDAPAGSDSGMR